MYSIRSGIQKFKTFCLDNKKILRSIALVCLACGLLWLLGTQLYAEYQRLGRAGISNLPLHWYWLWVVCLLIPVNWYLEVVKWRLFQQPALRLSWSDSWRAVLLGVAGSFITPNRSGEYAIRAWAAPPGSRTSGLQASLGAACCQLVALVGLGLPALALFARQQGGFSFFSTLDTPRIVGVLLLGVGLSAGSLFVFLRIFRHSGRFSAIKKMWVQLGQFHSKQLLAGVALSLLRYAVYTAQYAAMLAFVGVALPGRSVFAGVGTIYLVQTGLPLPPALGFLARGEVALLVWKAWQVAPLQVLTASYGLFALNLAFPAFVGIAWMLKQTAQEYFKTKV